jgi:hypothetical protein
LARTGGVGSTLPKPSGRNGSGVAPTRQAGAGALVVALPLVLGGGGRGAWLDGDPLVLLGGGGEVGEVGAEGGAGAPVGRPEHATSMITSSRAGTRPKARRGTASSMQHTDSTRSSDMDRVDPMRPRGALCLLPLL